MQQMPCCLIALPLQPLQLLQPPAPDTWFIRRPSLSRQRQRHRGFRHRIQAALLPKQPWLRRRHAKQQLTAQLPTQSLSR